MLLKIFIWMPSIVILIYGAYLSYKSYKRIWSPLEDPSLSDPKILKRKKLFYWGVLFVAGSLFYSIAIAIVTFMGVLEENKLFIFNIIMSVLAIAHVITGGTLIIVGFILKWKYSNQTDAEEEPKEKSKEESKSNEKYGNNQ